MNKLDIHTIQKLFKKRVPESHKGDHGHALIIGGSQSKMGAAIIAVKSCLRSGAGLVTVNIPKKERAAFFTAIPEAMVAFREEENHFDSYNAFAIGPGIGTGKSAEGLLKVVLDNAKSPIGKDLNVKKD